MESHRRDGGARMGEMKARGGKGSDTVIYEGNAGRGASRIQGLRQMILI